MIELKRTCLFFNARTSCYATFAREWESVLTTTARLSKAHNARLHFRIVYNTEHGALYQFSKLASLYGFLADATPGALRLPTIEYVNILVFRLQCQNSSPFVVCITEM